MWREALSLVWSDKWEAVLGILGILLALSAGVPLTIVIFSGLVLVLLVADLIRATRKALRMVREKHLPIMVIVGKGDDEYRAMVDDVLATVRRHHFDEREFDIEFNVEREDWTLRRESRLPKESQAWFDMVKRFERRINRLASKLKGRRIFHIFLNCPAALAVGLGAVLRTKYEEVLYHFVPGSGSTPYLPVIDFYDLSQKGKSGAMLIKGLVQAPYEFIELEKSNGMTPEVYVSLHLASHDPKGDVSILAASQGREGVHIRNKFSGVLPLESDWLQVAREVASVMMELIAQPGLNRVHLVLSCPVPLAFTIGMALGTQSSITVHNWFAEDQEYQPVLQLDQLSQN